MIIVAMLAIATLPVQARDLGDLGRFAQWSKIEIDLTGPESKGAGESNPFKVSVDCEFTAPGGKRYLVPGFYDGDGRGGLDGHVWRVRFSPDQLGRWSFRTRSPHPSLNDRSGFFTVISPSPDAPAFYRWGRLVAASTDTASQVKARYLKFQNGPYWLKAGCDDPENFLGRYTNYDTLEKRKAAIDYLAERGINSLYIMSHNLDGDDKDVWPWLGHTAREAKRNSAGEVRFDVARLHEWHMLFEYMQQRGVVVYLILEDDSAWKGYDHARYYREMIARFGHLPALVFNLGEEHNENYKLSEALDYMKLLAELDPFDHPCGIHNVNSPQDDYIRSPYVDFTSIQTGSPGTRRGLDNALQHNELARDWLRRCDELGQRRLVVNFDEGRPEHERSAWWAAYLAGGVWEAHVLEPYDRPMSAWETVWRELGGTRAFMEALPFWEMESHNELVKSGRALCLAKPGEAYALYLPEGGEVQVGLGSGAEYTVEWWDPANGRDGKWEKEEVVAGGVQTIVAPDGKNWAARIVARKK